MLSFSSKTLTKALSSQIRLNFCSIQNVVDKLRTNVEGQLDYESKNIQDTSSFKKYFQGEGWTIKYVETQIQLSKKKNDYEIAVLFNARSPMPMSQQQGQQQGENQPQDDYSQATVCIKKNGANKWLVADYLITNQESQLQNIQFLKDIAKEKESRASNKPGESGNYVGPQLNALDEKLLQSLDAFMQNFGLTPQFFKQASQFGIAYQQQFYINWLKDIRSLL